MDLTAIQSVLERVENVSDAIAKQRSFAYEQFNYLLDDFAEYIIKHTTDEGFYIEQSQKISNQYNIKSKRQYQRDECDKRREQGKSVRPFADFKYTDEDDNEYYTFENKPSYGYCFEEQLFEDIEYQTLIESTELTDEEITIFKLREKGFTLNDCSALSGLTIKQVRGRIDRYKKKLMLTDRVKNIIDEYNLQGKAEQ